MARQCLNSLLLLFVSVFFHYFISDIIFLMFSFHCFYYYVYHFLLYFSHIQHPEKIWKCMHLLEIKAYYLLMPLVHNIIERYFSENMKLINVGTQLHDVNKYVLFYVIAAHLNFLSFWLLFCYPFNQNCHLDDLRFLPATLPSFALSVLNSLNLFFSLCLSNISTVFFWLLAAVSL